MALLLRCHYPSTSASKTLVGILDPEIWVNETNDPSEPDERVIIFRGNRVSEIHRFDNGEESYSAWRHVITPGPPSHNCEAHTVTQNDLAFWTGRTSEQDQFREHVSASTPFSRSSVIVQVISRRRLVHSI